MKKLFLIFLGALIASAHAFTIGEYEALKQKNPRDLCLYLSGLSNGFYWGESMGLKSNEKNKNFCPEKQQISLNCQNHISLIDNYINLMKQTPVSSPLVSNEAPLEPTFYSVLRKAYSCN